MGFSEQPIMQEEIFGPLFPVCRFKDIEEAISFSRNLKTGKPLACYMYSRSTSNIDAVTKRTTSGGLCINDSIMHLSNHELPFGGVGASGMGSYHGHYSFAAMTHEKAVLQKYPGIDELPILKFLLAARFPPYTSTRQLIIKLFSMRQVAGLLNLPVRDAVRFFARVIGMVLLLRVGGYRVSIQ